MEGRLFRGGRTWVSLYAKEKERVKRERLELPERKWMIARQGRTRGERNGGHGGEAARDGTW